MPINANKVPRTASSKVPPLEPDNYPARLVQIIDLGLQPQRAYEGKDKPPAYTIMIGYEFTTEFMEDEDGNPDESKPRWLSEDFPLFPLSADRAKSTLRYKVLDPKGTHDGDWGALVGSACLVCVTQNENKGRIYNNISTTGGVPKGMEVAPLKNEPRIFDLDEPDLEIFNQLPEWIREKIQSNLEYNGSLLQQMLGESTEGPSNEEAPEIPEVNDDLPV